MLGPFFCRVKGARRFAFAGLQDAGATTRRRHEAAPTGSGFAGPFFCGRIGWVTAGRALAGSLFAGLQDAGATGKKAA